MEKGLSVSIEEASAIAQNHCVAGGVGGVSVPEVALGSSH